MGTLKKVLLYIFYQISSRNIKEQEFQKKNNSCHSLSYSIYFIFHNLGKSKRGDTSIKRKKLKDEDDWEPEIHDIKVEEDEDITDDLHDKGKL